MPRQVGGSNVTGNLKPGKNPCREVCRLRKSRCHCKILQAFAYCCKRQAASGTPRQYVNFTVLDEQDSTHEGHHCDWHGVR